MDKKILIIDDCHATGETLRIILGNSYKVICTATAMEGLKMLFENISLIFLDIMLPDLNGLEVLKKIKNNNPSIPVFILTAFGTEETCINAFRFGARDYIKKPFNTGELLRNVEIIMNTVSAERRRPVFICAEKAVSYKHYQGIPPHILNGILKVKDYVDKNHNVQLKLADACKMAGINRTYFCRYCKFILGYTFQNYIHVVKFQRAKDLIKDRNQRITDIAEQIGYSPKYFSKAFKRHFNNSPKKYYR